MKTYTEEDMQAAYEAGSDNTKLAGGSRGEEFNYLCLSFLDWLKEYNTPIPESEEELDFPWWLVKEKCGWSKWCDVTGGNHYAMNEWGELDKNETLTCTRPQAVKLKLI